MKSTMLSKQLIIVTLPSNIVGSNSYFKRNVFGTAFCEKAVK